MAVVDRRRVLAGGAGAAGVLAAGRARTAQPDETLARKPPFVLVHGTWHGGWVWRDVAALLRAAGHRVMTPTCTGCGERVHLAGPEVGLETHIQDIVNVLKFEELADVVLVGHSYSGLTITGVADREKSRIGRIVFFDALVPTAEVRSATPRDPATGVYPDWWLEREKKFTADGQMQFWDEYPVEMLVPADDSRNVERLRRLLTTHPSKQWTDELVLKNGGWDGLSPAYIHCIGQEYRQSSARMTGPATTDPQWTYIPIDAPRNAMMTDPDLVARTLLSLV